MVLLVLLWCCCGGERGHRLTCATACPAVATVIMTELWKRRGETNTWCSICIGICTCTCACIAHRYMRMRVKVKARVSVSVGVRVGVGVRATVLSGRRTMKMWGEGGGQSVKRGTPLGLGLRPRFQGRGAP